MRSHFIDLSHQYSGSGSGLYHVLIQYNDIVGCNLQHTDYELAYITLSRELFRTRPPKLNAYISVRTQHNTTTLFEKNIEFVYFLPPFSCTGEILRTMGIWFHLQWRIMWVSYICFGIKCSNWWMYRTINFAEQSVH